MDSTQLDDGATARMNTFLDGIVKHLKNKCQRASFAMYATGLLCDGDRKSMEPIAARSCACQTPIVGKTRTGGKPRQASTHSAVA